MVNRYRLSKAPVLDRLVIAVGFGLLMTVLFCAYVLLLYLFKGNAPFEDLNVSLGQVLSGYLVAGLLGSTTIGILLPLARWSLGRTALGMLAGILVYGAVSWTMDGSVDLFVALVAGIPTGGLLGWYWPKVWSS